MAAPVEDANVQREVNLTCQIHIIRPGNMANQNIGQLGVDVNHFEGQLAQDLAAYIIDALNAQEDNANLEKFVMRLHSDVNVNVNRALPDGSVFNVNANFTVKYNNDEFVMNHDVRLLKDALEIDYSSLIQNINNVGFFRQIEDLVINMDDEVPFVPIPPVAAPAQGVIPNLPPPPANENNENEAQGHGMNGGRRRRHTRRRQRRQTIRSRRHRNTRARRSGRKN